MPRVARTPSSSPKPLTPPQQLEPAAEWVDIKNLIPWIKNPRKNDPAIKIVADSIKAFGFGAPIIARKQSNEVIAGHTRLKAAQSLGMQVVPVRFLDISEEAAHKLALVDNRANELSGWDDELLYAQLGSYDPAEVALLGFSPKDMAELQRGLLQPSDNQDDPPHPNAELVKKWGVQLGQTWRIPSKTTEGKDHVLLIGDSTDLDAVKKLAGSESFAWMWTDPPYGVDYVGGFHGNPNRKGPKIQNDKATCPDVIARAFQAADSVLAPGAPFYIATPNNAVSIFLKTVETIWKMSQVLVWDKGSLVMGRNDYHFRHEFIIYGWKEGARHPWFGGRKLSTILEVPGPRKNELHPTMKPLDLIERTLVNSSLLGSRGYEPFAGSGSTILAAENLGRLCSAIEIDPLYASAILERFARLGFTPVQTKT